MKNVVSVFISDDLNLFQATVAERGLTSEYTRAHTTPHQNSAAPSERREKPSERSRSVGARVQLPADGERCPKSSCVRPFFSLTVLTFTQTWLIWPMACLYPVRETPICFGGAPQSQCCSGKQLWGLCGGGRTRWQRGTIHRQSAQLIPDNESLEPVNTTLNCTKGGQCWCFRSEINTVSGKN